MLIYKATNKTNGCGYIGQTTDTIKERILGHKNKSENNGSMLFHQAIREFGFDNFTWDTLCECSSKSELNKTEEEMIILHHTHYTEGGYNKQKRSRGNQGWCHSEETKQKMKNRIFTNEHKEKLSISKKGKESNRKNTIISDISKNKISNSLKKYYSNKTSEWWIEFNKKRSESTMGEKNPMYGKKRPEMMGDLNPAKRPNVREKIRIKAAGRKLSDETKQKISIANKGKILSEETKKKMKESRLKYLQNRGL